MTRYVLLVWPAWLLCLGCQSTLPGLGFFRATPLSAQRRLAEASRPSASSRPETAQAVSGAADALIGQVAQAQQAGPLQQASAAYEKGDDAQAIAHLETYVAQKPEHLIARAQLAELLFRQDRFDEARLHFEVFIAQAQEHADLAFRYLIHSHSRLVDIAAQQDAEYDEKLNRGIGLYLLGCRRTHEPDADQPPRADALFCKAAAQLQAARDREPEEARPDWYLYQTWTRLGQRHAARRALCAADNHALLSGLTPAERRQLQQACLAEQR